MVSVIIPVFETEEYLRQCLDSVVRQTYSDIEIILVVAHSSDNSARICEEYAKSDNRIRLIDQIGSGAGSARNQGVAESRGDYICFVDSDDWVDPQFIEKLYCAMTSNDVELVECDDYWGSNGTERIEGNSPYIGEEYNLLKVLGAPACWKQMYSKKMWDREGLRFTNTVAEDLFLYSDVYRVCRGSFFIREPLYYYRIRKGSYSDTAKKDLEQYQELFSMFEMLIKRYKERGLFNTCKEELFRQLIPHANNRYRALLGWIDDNTAIRLKSEGHLFFNEQFGRRQNSFGRNVKVFGSYNLGRIGNYLSADSINDMRYSFSSLIAAFSNISPESLIIINNNNTYREIMIRKEIERSLVKDIRDDAPDLLLIDFMEERYDIIDVEGCCYTGSEALKESCSLPSEHAVIANGSDEYCRLWKSACDRLVDLLMTVKERTQIVVIENYLSEYVGDIYHKSINMDADVRTINNRLKQCYDYFESRCSWANVIKAYEIPDNLVYTENGFEHGTTPEHLNLYYYGYVANKIADIIGG